MAKWWMAAIVAAAVVSVRADEILDRVLAVVGGDLILQSDVTAARDFGYAAAGDAADPTAAILSQLVDRDLVLTEVDRYAPPEPPASAIDLEMQRIRKRFDSDAEYGTALARSGLDARQLRQIVRQNLRMTAYLNERFTVLSPTEEEAARYYREHPAAFARDRQTRPFQDVRGEAAALWVADRRKALVDEWVAGLRRRADITDLYLPSQPGRR